ncbi:hypothetical protein ATANTOWER_011696, partial [Ataeniobius toweri]|nr:hypothetical protein [Ataeniobius toweri]
KPYLAPCWRSSEETLDCNLDSGYIPQLAAALVIHLSGKANLVQPPTIPPGSSEKPQSESARLHSFQTLKPSPWWITSTRIFDGPPGLLALRTFCIINKYLKRFSVFECSLHVGQVGLKKR